MTSNRIFVILSGAPGSGKTTLARTISHELRLPLLSKDTIKESLMDAYGVASINDSQRIGQAAIRVLFAIAAETHGAVLESVWRPSLVVEDFNQLDGSLIELFCACPPDLAKQRYAQRAADRHPGHFDTARLNDDLWESETAQPVNGGWRCIHVGTTTRIDIVALAHEITKLVEKPEN